MSAVAAIVAVIFVIILLSIIFSGGSLFEFLFLAWIFT